MRLAINIRKVWKTLRHERATGIQHQGQDGALRFGLAAQREHAVNHCESLRGVRATTLPLHLTQKSLVQNRQDAYKTFSNPTRQ